MIKNDAGDIRSISALLNTTIYSYMMHDSYKCTSYIHYTLVNSLRPRQNDRHFANDFFKCIFVKENVQVSIKIALKFVPEGPINNIPALVQIIGWHRPGDKTLFEPMMVSVLMHIWVTRPQWVNHWQAFFLGKHRNTFAFYIDSRYQNVWAPDTLQCCSADTLQANQVPCLSQHRSLNIM